MAGGSDCCVMTNLVIVNIFYTPERSGLFWLQVLCSGWCEDKRIATGGADCKLLLFDVPT